MKKFIRIKTVKEIRTQCKAQGVPLEDSDYKFHSDDYIVVGTPGQGHVFYNTYNGNFFGQTPHGPKTKEWPARTPFQSYTDKFEKEKWFRALLAFFYVE